MVAIVFVDETIGSDETGLGTADSPYQSATKALEAYGDSSDSIKIQIRKSPEEEGGYKDISGAALKKAKKRVEEQQKKLKKQEEQRKKQVEEDILKKQQEEQRLEEAKAIVLVEDDSLPKAEKVSIFTDLELWVNN